MADFGLKIDGVDALLKVMDAIEADMESANGYAVVAGARVIQKEAKNLVPVKTGNLKKSIKIKLLKPKEKGQRLAIIGPASGKREPNDGYYGKWVEEGHKIARIEYGDSKTKAHPFMRPAYDNKIGEAQQKMAETYQKAIDRKFDKGKTIDALGDIIEGD